MLDVFDEWRRAIGLTASSEASEEASTPETTRRTSSNSGLPAHLERVLLRLTDVRTKGAIGSEADSLIDRVSRELDGARATPGGLRGEARRALIDRLAILDRELLTLVAAQSVPDHQAIEKEAAEELAEFRNRMSAEAFARAHAAVVDRIVRERFGIPVIAF